MIKAVTVDQLNDDQEYEEILEDMRDECSKFGMCVDYFSNLFMLVVKNIV